jgi:hypothetical protein
MEKMQYDYDSPVSIEILGGKGKDKKVKIMYMRNYLNPKTSSDNISEDNPNKQYDDDFIDYKYDNYKMPL